jgi:hypothetical protein
MILGIDNSLANPDPLDGGVCRVALYAPIWVQNRTGLDLAFQDKPSAHGMLLGYHSAWDFNEVVATGEWHCPTRLRCVWLDVRAVCSSLRPPQGARAPSACAWTE